MHKKDKLIVLLILISMTFPNNVYAKEESKGIWTYVAATAAAVTAGVGAYKLVEWCCTETNVQLIERAQREYKNALCFFEDGTLSEFERIQDFSDECVAYTLARLWLNRGILSSPYAHSVINTEYQLSNVSKKLRERIQEHQGKYLDHSEKQQVEKMRIMIRKIDSYLSDLSILSKYLKENMSYFSLFDCESDMRQKYHTILNISSSGNPYYVVINDVYQNVMWHYGDRRYPLITFVSGLESDMSLLYYNIRSLSYQYQERLYYAQQLLDSLKWIKGAIVSDNRYQQEIYQKEQDRLEQLRIEAKQEQIRIERAQIAAQRKHNRVVAQNNMLRSISDHNKQQEKHITVIVQS